VNNELDRLWMEELVWFEALSWHLPGKTKETSVRILSVPAEIRTGHLSMQKCY
jgi:hypothetical protein